MVLEKYEVMMKTEFNWLQIISRPDRFCYVSVYGFPLNHERKTFYLSFFFLQFVTRANSALGPRLFRLTQS